MSFSQSFDKICEEYRDDILFYFFNKSIKVSYTYARVLELVRRCDLYLQSKGMETGDRLITIMHNSPEQMIIFLACIYGGYGYAPLPADSTIRDFNRWDMTVKCKCVFLDDEIGIDIKDAARVIVDGNFFWLNDFDPEEYITHSASGAKVFVSTSGSTGTPKAIQVDGDTLWEAAKGMADEYGLLGKRCRFWNYLSMAYMGGFLNLTLIPVATGGSFLLTRKFMGGYFLDFWKIVEEYSVDSLWFSPTIIRGLLTITDRFANTFKSYCEEHLKICFVGFAPIQKVVKERMEDEMGVNIFENYALSETCFLIGEKTDDLDEREDSSVGKPYSFTECKFVGIDGSSELYGLWVKTPYLFDGYIDPDGNLSLEKDEDGYFNTKDIVKIKNGNIILAGRNRDIIKKGGEMIVLSEIESVTRNIVGDHDVSAVPVEDPFYGENYVLCIAADADDPEEKAVIADRIMDSLKQQLSHSKIPARVVILDKFPVTESGKIKKAELREIVADEKENGQGKA